MPIMYVHDGGTWKDVIPGGLYVRDAGVWKQVSYGYVKDAGAWKQFYVKSDPLTVSIYPDWTQGYMYGGENCVGSILSGVRDDDVPQGYWDVSQSSPAGTWSHTTGIIAFRDLDAYLATRPVVKSATLRLTLAVGYGGDPKNTNVMIGSWDASAHASAPSTLSHTDTDRNVQDTGDLFTADNQTKSITLNSAMRTWLQTRPGIALHDTSHSTSEAGKRATRAIFEGASAGTAVRPMLTVTLDYI